MNTVGIKHFQRAAMLLLVGLALSGCRSMYEFTVIQQDANSAILARVSNLLLAQEFKPISPVYRFNPDDNPRMKGCHVLDHGTFSKQSRLGSGWYASNRWFSVNYVLCDGHLMFDVASTADDTLTNHDLRKLVNLLQHELASEIAAGQVTVKTKDYVALGP